MDKIKVIDFFNTDYVDSASYDNLRKISSMCDGLKNSSRKAIYTVLDKNVNSKTKLDTLASTIASHTEYLHGSAGLTNVLVNLAQNYVGSNNIPLLKRDGNFGTRFEPESSAPRYIKTRKEDFLDKLFNKNDSNILDTQVFEGSEIEPRYYMPIIPLLLVNGSLGISFGFSQTILPRCPKTIISELEKVLKGTKKLENVKLGKPTWNGFNGEIIEDSEAPNKWYIHGQLERINKTMVKINELPIGYSLKKYNSILDDLEDKNIIQSFKDKSNNDVYSFELRVKRDFSDKITDEKMKDKFKLVKAVTENFTCIDEKNRIKVYNSSEELFSDYFKLRLNKYEERKTYILNKMNSTCDKLESRFLFIKNVTENKIIISKKSKDNIISQIEKVDKIIKIDDNYDYLLNMNLYSLTKEKMDEYKNKIKDIKTEIKELRAKKKEELWLEDLKDLKKLL